MTTTTSGRIDIDGQNGLCGGEVTVSRSMPAILTDRMNYQSWTKFCSQVDEALEPISKVKKRMVICVMLWVTVPILMIIIGVVSFTQSMNDFNSSSSSSPAMAFIPFFIVFLGVFVTSCVTMGWAAKISHGVETELRRICDESSTLHSGISFHLREERYITGQGSNLRSAKSNYIEVSVSNTIAMPVSPIVDASAPLYVSGNTFPTAPGYDVESVPVTPVVTAVAEPEIDLTAGRRSAAERMRELDQMKSLLTEEEYQRKRAEILSDV